MTLTIRIKRVGPRGLYFEVVRRSGESLATSEPFDTICRLESGLATLVEMARSPDLVGVERNAARTSLSPATRRRQVGFAGCLADDAIRELLAGTEAATVIDERPVAQRRSNLSGPLCNLER